MISRTLLHIYGPIYIYSFGAIIALGCMLTYFLLARNPKSRLLIDTERLLNVCSLSIIAAIFGGRLLYSIGSYKTMHTWRDIVNLHEGGFSILGAILAILCIVPWYLKKIGTPILPFMDLMALYAPLLQAISRIGCFFAGCCYGKPTDLFWGITYTNPDTLAPLFCALHPTQLYMACGDLLIFLCGYIYGQRICTKPGQWLCAYLILSSLNRFIVDFWRDDQEFLAVPALRIFSLHQWIALGIIISSMTYVIYSTRKDQAL